MGYPDLFKINKNKIFRFNRASKLLRQVLYIHKNNIQNYLLIVNKDMYVLCSLKKVTSVDKFCYKKS